MVLTPKQADTHDNLNGLLMILGLVLTHWRPYFGLGLILMFGIDAICVAIDRHLPANSEHRKTVSE